MTKIQLRKICRQKRLSLSETDAHEKSLAIAELFLTNFQRFDLLHTFIPIKKYNEPDVSLIYNQLPVYAKVFISKTLKSGELMHIHWDSTVLLKENKWGVIEPENTAGVLDSASFFRNFKHQKIIVLVPLLAFDTHGNRLGYGGGYYDRFLAQAHENTLKVGISFFEPVPDIPDVQIHDIKLDYCITPKQVWHFKAG